MCYLKFTTTALYENGKAIALNSVEIKIVRTEVRIPQVEFAQRIISFLDRTIFFNVEYIRDRARRLTDGPGLVPTNDNRWADLVMNARVINGVPFRMTQYTATRNFAAGAKQTDDYFVFDNVASDTRWVMDFCGFFMQLSLRYGATLEQARYIAAVAAINAIAVSYGVDPNDGGHGAIPGAHGFVEPHRFPDPFRCRGH